MNSGVLLQMMGGGSMSTKTINTQVSSSSNYASNSFKREMDKAFDKTVTYSEAKKNIAFNKQNQNDKPQNKVDSSKYPNSKNEFSSEGKDVNALTEEQIVASSMQMNQQSVVMPEELDNFLNEGNLLLEGMEKTTNGMGNDLLKALTSNGNFDEELAVPVPNNIDLAKANMLKILQNHESEIEIRSMQEMPDEGINLNQINSQEESVETEENKISNKDDLNLENLELIEDQDGMPRDNIMAKSSQLDPTKVNVKVAEAPIDTTKADMANQLADKILHKMNQGNHEFELELYPRNLGKVNIKMIFANGSAELVMSSSNSKTHQLLSMQTEAIKAILEGNTGMDSNIQMNQAESNDSQFDRDNFQEQNNNSQQNQKHQNEQEKLNESTSFMDRLRLGLISEMEQAV